MVKQNDYAELEDLVKVIANTYQGTILFNVAFQSDRFSRETIDSLGLLLMYEWRDGKIALEDEGAELIKALRYARGKYLRLVSIEKETGHKIIDSPQPKPSAFFSVFISYSHTNRYIHVPGTYIGPLYCGAFAHRQSQAIELSYFGGLTFDEIATAFEVSSATVKRDLTTAKIWLLHELKQNEAAGRSRNGGAVS